MTGTLSRKLKLGVVQMSMSDDVDDNSNRALALFLPD